MDEWMDGWMGWIDEWMDGGGLMNGWRGVEDGRVE